MHKPIKYVEKGLTIAAAGSLRDAFRKVLAADIEKWGKVIKAAGIKGE